MDDRRGLPVQVAVCCSQEQMHTQEFIRTVESTVVIDDDTAVSNTVLPQLGEFRLC